MNAQRLTLVVAAAALSLLGSCAHEPGRGAPTDRAHSGDGLTHAGGVGVMVGAMPVSATVGPDLSNSSAQQVRLVTVKLNRPIMITQVFTVAYDVRNSTGASAPDDVVVKSRSPRQVRVVPTDIPSDSFAFWVYTTKGQRTEVHQVRVQVAYESEKVVAEPFEARPTDAD